MRHSTRTAWASSPSAVASHSACSAISPLAVLHAADFRLMPMRRAHSLGCISRVPLAAHPLTIGTCARDASSVGNFCCAPMCTASAALPLPSICSARGNTVALVGPRPLTPHAFIFSSSRGAVQRAPSTGDVSSAAVHALPWPSLRSLLLIAPANSLSRKPCIDDPFAP